jgi:hypothetical protein
VVAKNSPFFLLVASKPLSLPIGCKKHTAIFCQLLPSIVCSHWLQIVKALLIGEKPMIKAFLLADSS